MNSTTMVKNEAGDYVTAIPLPYYGLKKQCTCGKAFWKEENYEKHYVYEHFWKGIPSKSL